MLRYYAPMLVEFKTDNGPLFEFSLEEIQAAGWKLMTCTYDLHHDVKLAEGNIMTEYEEKFREWEILFTS